MSGEQEKPEGNYEKLDDVPATEGKKLNFSYKNANSLEKQACVGICRYCTLWFYWSINLSIVDSIPVHNVYHGR